MRPPRKILYMWGSRKIRERIFVVREEWPFNVQIKEFRSTHTYKERERETDEI